jgi:predicted O-methyltransferase YrrM
MSAEAPKQIGPEGRCVSLADLDVKIGSLLGTSKEQCHSLYEFVLTNPVSQILELGFSHGKSSAYMAAALAAKGSGLITTIDLRGARSCKPSIREVAAMTELASYINPIFSDVGGAWEMRKMIVESTEAGRHCKPVFDFCFIDAYHSWEMTGIDFFLADKLLKPGCWLLFDDIQWSFETSPSWSKRAATKAMAPDYRSAQQVGDVFRYLVTQHPGYENCRIEDNWGWAQKKR